MRKDPPTLFRAVALFAATGLVAATAPAAPPLRADRVPAQLEGVGITESFGAQVPLDAVFSDEDGNQVTLARYVRGDKPVLLTLVYYECPMLCGLVLNGVADGLKGLAWSPGKEFEVVTLSINPTETPALARLKKQNLLREYGRAGAAGGWHFLTGSDEQIHRVADAVGFHYRWDESKHQFAHAAGIVLLTPGGKVARYLYGISYPSSTLRLGLNEAADGSLGSPVDQLLLYCCAYDPTAGTYTVVAARVMQVGGVATALLLGSFLGFFWWREARRKRRVGTLEPGEQAT